MAVVTGLDPAAVAVVVVMLSRPWPTRLLAAYFAGGFGTSLIVGVVILFAMNGIGIGDRSAVPPGIDFAVGALALIVAFLVGSGIAGRVRGRRQKRRGDSGGGDAVMVDTTAAEVPRGLERLPAFQKLPPRTQKAVCGVNGPWTADKSPARRAGCRAPRLDGLRFSHVGSVWCNDRCYIRLALSRHRAAEVNRAITILTCWPPSGRLGASR